MNDKLITLPLGDGGMRLYGGGCLTRRRVHDIDRHVCRTHRLLDIALAKVRRRRFTVFRLDRLIEPLLEGEQSRFLMVDRPHQPRSMLSCLEGLGDDQRNRLSRIDDVDGRPGWVARTAGLLDMADE